LSARTIRARRSAKVAIGTGGDKRLERASRVHANFAEHVPFGLLLIALTEIWGMPSVIIHLRCLALLRAHRLPCPFKRTPHSRMGRIERLRKFPFSYRGDDVHVKHDWSSSSFYFGKLFYLMR